MGTLCNSLKLCRTDGFLYKKTVPILEVLGHIFMESRNDGNRSECSTTEYLLVLIIIISEIGNKFGVPNVNRKIVFGMKC